MIRRIKTTPPADQVAAWPVDSGDFLQSLTPVQRHWLLEREAAREQQLQNAFAMLSRGLAPVIAVHGELLEERLHVHPEPLALEPRIDLPTLQAYATTRFRVDLAPSATTKGKRTGKHLELRIGKRNAGLATLHASHGVTESIFVTAWNPLGQALNPEANREAHLGLLAWLEARGFAYLSGRGIGDDPGWDPEESVLVLGGSSDLARALCIRFRQNAVVHAGADAVPALILHPAARLF